MAVIQSPQDTVAYVDQKGKPSKDFYNWVRFISTAFLRLSRPPSSITPTDNGDLVIQATSDTSLTFKYKGSDGTVRSASLTLS